MQITPVQPKQLSPHGEQIKIGATVRSSIRECLDGVIQQWNRTERSISTQVNNVPKSLQPLVELQMATHRLQLGVELVSRTAESAAAVLRKAQQSGG